MRSYPLPSKETAESIIEGDACPVNKDFVWQTLCKEAREEAQYEPALASYLFSTILSRQVAEDRRVCPRETSSRATSSSTRSCSRCSRRSIAGMGCL